MKKYIILIAILILINIGIKAQKIEVSYGTLMGLNYSFVNVNSATSKYYTFDEKDQNFTFDNSYKGKAGYDIGIFFKLNPVKSRFNLESGLILSKYSNSYTVFLSYDNYATTSSIETWTKETAEETISNDFSVIKIPLFIGFNLLNTGKFQLEIQSGISVNICMDEDHKFLDLNNEEDQLYKDYFAGFQMGIRAYFNKIFCQLKYDRSFNMQEGSSRTYFPWEMEVDGIFLSSVSISVGYMF
jgi:hypothetical protein